jgi:LacI family transcriptional regulator
MSKWLERSIGQPLPHAIFCVNDSSAIGCLEALAEVGLRVPEDVSLAGFDDTLAARTTVPQLTTVRQPLQAMGSRAVETLLARIRHHHGHATPEIQETIVFPTEIVWRDSVGTPTAPQKMVPAS